MLIYEQELVLLMLCQKKCLPEIQFQNWQKFKRGLTFMQVFLFTLANIYYEIPGIQL